MMQHLDEVTIHSWLDGALSAEEAARVEAHVVECPRCAAAVAEARGFIAAASRILTALDNAPRGVVPAAVPRKRVDPLFWRVAATVLILAGGTLVTLRSRADNDSVMSTSTDNASRSLHATPYPARKPAPIPPSTASTDKRGPRATASNPPAGGVSGQITPEPGAALPGRERKALAAGTIAQTGRSAGAAETAGGAAPAATALAPSRAAGVFAKGAQSDLGPLKVVSATRRTGAKVTIYEVAPGDTVTLTETIPLSLDLVVVTGPGTPIALQATGKSAPTPSPATSKTRVDAILAPAPESQRPARAPLSAPTASASAPAQPGNNTIKWTDPATGNALMLTGPMPESRLQGIRLRIERERAAAAVKKSP